MSRWGDTVEALRAELKVAWMLALQYRMSLVGECVSAVFWLAFTLFPVLVVYQYRPGIEGWTYPETLLVVGLFIALQGILQAFIDPNLRAVVQHVRRGTMDFILLKPIDAQLLVSVHRTAPAKLPHAAAGLLLTLYGALRLPTPPNATDVALALTLLLLSSILLYSLWTLIVSLSFWFVKVDNLAHLLMGFLDTARWPVSFYQGWMRIFLTFIVPVGLMTTFPALALRGVLGAHGVGASLLVTVLFVAGSRAVWKAALRHYSSASS